MKKKRRERIERLGEALAFGEESVFNGCLTADCKYHSDYSKIDLNSADEIIEQQ